MYIILACSSIINQYKFLNHTFLNHYQATHRTIITMLSLIVIFERWQKFWKISIILKMILNCSLKTKIKQKLNILCTVQLKLLRKKYSTKKYYKKQFFLTLNTLYRKHIEMVPQGNSYFIRTLLQFYQGKTRCMQNQVSMNYESQSMTGFHGLPDPEADRSKLV